MIEFVVELICMFSIRIIILSGFLLVGCAPTVVAPTVDTAELLSGEVLFGQRIETAGIDSDAVLALSDSMRLFVDTKVEGYPQARARLRRLVGGMVDDGLLTIDYDASQTLTAAETFEQRQGNCLSFSILFVALAREAGLDATFQMVDVPPSFRADGDVVMLDNHINVRVAGLRKDVLHTSDFVVDFNNAEYKGNYRTKKVKDNYAIALYYSNVAVELMRGADWKSAFRHLKKAIEIDARIPGIWVNLGVLYSQNNYPDMAIQAYQQALSIRPSNRSALVNLATTLGQLGRDEEANYYAGRVEYYRNRHPYYHYYLAQSAYEEDRLGDALGHLDRAMRLKEDEHQFFYLRGLVYLKSDQLARAADDFGRARDFTDDPRLVEGYTKKLDELAPRLN